MQMLLTVVPGPNGQLAFEAKIADELLENWPLAYDMLEGAKTIIKQKHVEMLTEKRKTGIIVAPAGALNTLRPPGMNGRHPNG